MIDRVPVMGAERQLLGDKSMVGLEGVSAQALSDTEVIYDCAFDPNRWQDAAGRILDLSESQGCGTSATALFGQETIDFNLRWPVEDALRERPNFLSERRNHLTVLIACCLRWIGLIK